jgi:hypothetical protein
VNDAVQRPLRLGPRQERLSLRGVSRISDLPWGVYRAAERFKGFPSPGRQERPVAARAERFDQRAADAPGCADHEDVLR